jgi:hypothetical protein
MIMIYKIRTLLSIALIMSITSIVSIFYITKSDSQQYAEITDRLLDILFKIEMLLISPFYL